MGASGVGMCKEVSWKEVVEVVLEDREGSWP